MLSLSRFRLANQRIGFLRFAALLIRKVNGMGESLRLGQAMNNSVGLLALADTRDRESQALQDAPQIAASAPERWGTAWNVTLPFARALVAFTVDNG
jgi:hypothetical protein